jgi:hypothetical protein
MTAPSYYVPALVYARAALARGPLTEHRIMHGGKGVFWRCGHRLFSAKTVRLLINAGEAVRVGHHIMSVAEAVRRTPRPAPPVTTPAGGATITIGAAS